MGAAEMTEQMPPEREDLVDVFYIPFVRHVLPAGLRSHVSR